MLVRRGRVLVQLGGKTPGRSGWMTRTIGETEADARVGFQTMLDEYTNDGYTQVLWDADAWPDVPAEIFDPAS